MRARLVYLNRGVLYLECHSDSVRLTAGASRFTCQNGVNTGRVKVVPTRPVLDGFTATGKSFFDLFNGLRHVGPLLNVIN